MWGPKIKGRPIKMVTSNLDTQRTGRSQFPKEEVLLKKKVTSKMDAE